MGKNKGKKKQKADSVFKVAGHKALKAKGRAKAVATNLKKLNFHMQKQIAKSNAQLKSVQQMVSSNSRSQKSAQNDCNVDKPKKEIEPPIDVDEAVNDMQRLWQ